MTSSISTLSTACGDAEKHVLAVRYYPAEHYFTLFNTQTGFFGRIEEPGHSDPFWSVHGPEIMDVSITNWCDRECSTCYRSSAISGRHVSICDYRMVLNEAARSGVHQVALGGGNPNQHPNFASILRITRHEYGVVPNFTTNGRGLSDDVLRAARECCGAVAVSAYEPYRQFADSVRCLVNFGIKTNVHFVVDVATVSTALRWLNDPPRFLSGINAIIFLNYKPIGRGSSNRQLLRHSPDCRSFLHTASMPRRDFKIGFDSCMVSGLACDTLVDPRWYDACEAARFSMYVSETLRMYPCSFMETTHAGIPLAPGELIRAWRDSKLFRQTREHIQKPACGERRCASVCRGGCPVFPEINLCDQHHGFPLRSSDWGDQGQT